MQLSILVIGAIFHGINYPGSVYDLLSLSLSHLGFMMVPVAVGVAVLRYHLYDIDAIINRTLVYGALTAIIIGLYVLLVAGLGTILQSRDFFVSLVATGLVAVIFAPLRSRLQRGVNRLMYGERDEPYAVLSRLGQSLESTASGDALLSTITCTIARALKLPHTAIALNTVEGSEIVASWGEAPQSLHSVPLVYQGEEIGELRLSPRARGEFHIHR